MGLQTPDTISEKKQEVNLVGKMVVLQWGGRRRLISMVTKACLPRLPDSIARPIAIMPLSRMENTTFAMPSIIDSHDMGLRTVYNPDAQKKTPIQNA
ncbi:hypothetical protein TNCV_2930541 [Trichonephila clavipes]|nr:hypothetical protein TNCV_2930541 [Trichonephila clavipes]